jgi:hypothetical protein
MLYCLIGAIISIVAFSVVTNIHERELARILPHRQAQ